MRKIFDFHGGIHPPENKHQSTHVGLRQAAIPAQLIYPLSQHIGAPAEAVVSVGEKVLKGQQIAAASGFVSVPIHASTSGTIAAIEERPVAHPSGLTAPCIVLDSDGEDRWIEHSGVEDYRQLERTELLALIRAAGIAGMGGAGFPSAVKLAVDPQRTPIQTLIINGTECEPYITADDMAMRERAAEIVRGAEILGHLIQPVETLIGVEDNKPEGLAALRAAAANSAVTIVEFPTKYPSGGEKQLIEILTGKQVPSGGLPSDVGIVCQNVGTTIAIDRAIHQGEPLISRITTVTGEAASEPGNFEVLLGTPMADLLQQAGYRSDLNRRLVMGGPMMGFTVHSAAVPIVKTTNCLLVPTVTELPAPPPAQACIRCGLCAEACPASLLPQQMFWFAQGKEFEKLEQHNLFDCIECGACSWVCPSNIPLVQYYRASKAEILQLREDHAKSEHSRSRFEARQERLDREATEKEAQRKARKAAAAERARQAADNTGTEEQDPVQAAIDRAKAKKQSQQDSATAAIATSAAETPAPTDTEATGNRTDAASTDPAQAAIERARAARAATDDLSPLDKARAGLDRLQQRKASSQDKLEKARAAGEQEKVITALEASLVKLDEKIASAEAELKQLGEG